MGYMVALVSNTPGHPQCFLAKKSYTWLVDARRLAGNMSLQSFLAVFVQVRIRYRSIHGTDMG